MVRWSEWDSCGAVWKLAVTVEVVHKEIALKGRLAKLKSCMFFGFLIFFLPNGQNFVIAFHEY